MDEYSNRMLVQLQIIAIDKWDEGVRTCCDPGEQYIFKWVEEKSIDFAEKWAISSCRKCFMVLECGIKLLTKCDKFKNMTLKEGC